MRIYKDVSLCDFEPWQGAIYTMNHLTDDELNLLESTLEETAPENGYSETEINDILWFERDWIAQILGYEDWEDLLRKHEERGIQYNETD